MRFSSWIQHVDTWGGGSPPAPSGQSGSMRRTFSVLHWQTGEGLSLLQLPLLNSFHMGKETCGRMNRPPCLSSHGGVLSTSSRFYVLIYSIKKYIFLIFFSVLLSWYWHWNTTEKNTKRLTKCLHLFPCILYQNLVGLAEPPADSPSLRFQVRHYCKNVAITIKQTMRWYSLKRGIKRENTIALTMQLIQIFFSRITPLICRWYLHVCMYAMYSKCKHKWGKRSAIPKVFSVKASVNAVTWRRCAVRRTSMVANVVQDTSRMEVRWGWRAVQSAQTQQEAQSEAQRNHQLDTFFREITKPSDNGWTWDRIYLSKEAPAAPPCIKPAFDEESPQLLPGQPPAHCWDSNMAVSTQRVGFQSFWKSEFPVRLMVVYWVLSRHALFRRHASWTDYHYLLWYKLAHMFSYKGSQVESVSCFRVTITNVFQNYKFIISDKWSGKYLFYISFSFLAAFEEENATFGRKHRQYVQKPVNVYVL